jgi:hypothetical protein
LTAEQFGGFMLQPACQLAEFLHNGWQRRWHDPPLAVLFAEGLSAEEAAVVDQAADGELFPGVSDQFYSSLSDDYYDVYSDAYYDPGTP